MKQSFPFFYSWPTVDYSSTCAAAPISIATPPNNVPCGACVGVAIFVLEELRCEAVEVRVSTVVTGARAETAEGVAIEVTAEQLLQP